MTSIFVALFDAGLKGIVMNEWFLMQNLKIDRDVETVEPQVQ